MVESGGMDYNPNGSPVTSPKGAMYGMQVMPSTAANPGLGVNPAKDNSPAEMNRVGVDYQNALLKKYNGNQTLAAAAYNAGPTAVDNALLQSNNDPQKALGLLPKETQNYVVKIANATNKPPAAGSTSNTPNPMAALKEARYIWAMQNPKAAAIYGINPKDYEPPDGMTYSGDGSGRLVPVQGNKNTDPQAVSDAKAAQEAGTNVADATKTFNVAASNFPRAMQRFEQLRQAASDASYGIGVDEKEPGSTGDFNRVFAKTFLAQYIEPKTAVANQIMEQATNQGVLSELGPQLAGLKGNKFLEGIASGASGLDLADPPAAKLNAINGLQDQYISNMKSLISQRRNYGDKTAPTELELSNLIAQHAKPTDMISVVDPKGNLGRVPASDLASLVQDGGQIR